MKPIYIVVLGVVILAVLIVGYNQGWFQPKAQASPTIVRERQPITVQVNPSPKFTYFYTVRQDPNDESKCIFLKITNSNGVKVTEEQISQDNFLSIFGGWAGVCKKFSNVSPCMKNMCSVIKF